MSKKIILLNLAFSFYLSTSSLAFALSPEKYAYLYKTGNTRDLERANEKLRILLAEDEKIIQTIKNSIHKNYIKKKSGSPNCKKKCIKLLKGLAMLGDKTLSNYIKELQDDKNAKYIRKYAKKIMKLNETIAKERADFIKIQKNYPMNQEKRMF